mgnify:CR=1 FL=1
MKNNIYFCFEQIRANIIDIAFKIIQICTAFIILAYLIQSVVNYNKVNKQITSVLEEKNIYTISSRMISDHRFSDLDESKYTKSFQRLVAEIQGFPDLMVANTEDYVSLKGEGILSIAVTPNFFDSFNLEVGKHVENWKENFVIHYEHDEKWAESIKPAIVGYNYSKEYTLGDIITYDYGKEYEIIGFLKKNAFISLPMQSAEPKNLNTAIIVPANIDLSDNGSMMSFIFSSMFMVKERAELARIEEINAEEKLLEMNIKNYSEQMTYVRSDTIEKIILYATFGAILTVFSIISTICMIIQLISDYSYEYAVNLLCGASLGDIIQRIVFQFSIMLGIGILLTGLVVGINQGFLCVLFFAAMYIMILIFYTKYKIDYYNLVNNLRGKDKK